MTPAWWMAALSIATWLAAATFPGIEADREIAFGMLGPLAGALGTWILVERTYTTRPERLTGLMIAAFMAKAVFFGVYVTVMLKALSLRPVAFVTSFTTYFIALHVAEAVCLRRLFQRGM
jgi:hypothetical protein